MAGHSLGEYTALAAAGCLALADAARLLRLRGRGHATGGPGGRRRNGRADRRRSGPGRGNRQGGRRGRGLRGRQRQRTGSGRHQRYGVRGGARVGARAGSRHQARRDAAGERTFPLAAAGTGGGDHGGGIQGGPVHAARRPRRFQRDRPPGSRGIRRAGAARSTGDGDGPLARERASHGGRGRGYADRDRRRPRAHRACEAYRPGDRRKRGPAPLRRSMPCWGGRLRRGRQRQQGAARDVRSVGKGGAGHGRIGRYRRRHRRGPSPPGGGSGALRPARGCAGGAGCAARGGRPMWLPCDLADRARPRGPARTRGGGSRVRPPSSSIAAESPATVSRSA